MWSSWSGGTVSVPETMLSVMKLQSGARCADEDVDNVWERKAGATCLIKNEISDDGTSFWALMVVM